MSDRLEIGKLPFERRNELRLGLAFAFSWDEGYLEGGADPDFDALYEADRSYCGFDGETVVGTLGVFSLRMTVPGGGVLPTAGTTAVTVRPTHRRRGLLRRMMAAHFDDIRERGEPAAALWASESNIYRRFGFGEAAHLCGMKIDRAHTQLLPEAEAPGSCRMVEGDEALALFPDIYDRARRERAGMMERGDAWWKHRTLRDAPYSRDGGTPYRRIVYESAGQAEGYLLYRTRSRGGENDVTVYELIGATDEAERALCAVACSIDLARGIHLWNQPLDCPLPGLLASPRRLTREIRDSLWVRLTRVEDALSQRGYAGSGRVTIGVADATWPDNQGVFELDVEAGSARCRKREATDPQIELDVADLSAAYLGGFGVAELFRAGRARGAPEAIRTADALFRTERPPYNPEIF